ncbi:MAG: hypothetical protein AAF411_32160, partial [Myxococcota bacterium]
MRRGATEAFAEVDFIDRHGTRCRARWDVWRARKRADGRMQNQRMALHDLEASRELTGSTKTETLRQIETRLGLSFEEFRRAVLLAQGDFAAFLRAPADERAHLLEKMTGTHLFGAISRAAFGRCREAEQALKAAETEQAAIDVLSPEALAALEKERAHHAQAKTVESARRGAASIDLRWYEELDRATAAVEAAKTLLAEARQTASEAQTAREQLHRAERAERLRSPFEAFERARSERAAATRREGEAKSALEAAQTAADGAQTTLAEAETERSQLRAHYEAEAEGVARARDLDGRVAEAEEAATRLTAQTEARQVEAREARAALDAALERKTEADATLETHRRWLSDNEDLQSVAAQWPNYNADLEQAQTLLARVTTAQADAERLEARWRSLSEKTEMADKVAKQALTALTQAQADLRQRQAALAEIRARIPPKARREAMETLAELRAALERLMTLLPNARRLDRRIREERRAHRTAVKYAKEAKVRLGRRQEVRELGSAEPADVVEARA